MEIENLHYSMIQFSPYPERFEYVNVGVVVFASSGQKIAFKLTNEHSRVKKFFGDINSMFLTRALHDFAQRISLELARGRFSDLSVDDFNAKRADMFHLTPIFAVAGRSAESVANKLFEELVSLSSHPKRVDKINTLLTNAFRDAGVLSLLEKRPEPVHIAQYGVSVQADYGYQNGVYNLIDAARFDNPQRGLAEAGKRVLEGRALAEMLGRRLVVVGEFGDQPDSFVDHLRNDFENVGAKLFRLEEVNELASEIRKAAN